MSLRVSVLIPTYRRKLYLLHTLSCFEGQTIKPCEIIVLDASEDQYALSTTDLQVFTSNLNYIRWPEIGNVSRQRNEAIRRSTGDIILFVDDDVDFNNTLIESHIAVYKSLRVDAVSGVVENRYHSFGAPPATKFSRLLDPHAPNLQPCNSIEPTHVICTANFSVTRKVLLDMRGFDENIFGVMDDVEFGVRLVRKGYNCIHHPGPRVYHFMARSSGARTPALGPEWSLSNIIYFQLKHFYSNKPNQLLGIVLWEYYKPTGNWLKPLKLVKLYQTISRAFSNARRRFIEGEKLLEWEN